jgi:hypothetical protein
VIARMTATSTPERWSLAQNLTCQYSEEQLTNDAKCSSEEYVQVIVRKGAERTHTTRLCRSNKCACTGGIRNEIGGVHVAAASKLLQLALYIMLRWDLSYALLH